MIRFIIFIYIIQIKIDDFVNFGSFYLIFFLNTRTSKLIIAF